MPSFQPFSSGGQSTHLHTPEATTPLRKRENDSFASPDAPLLWRHPLQAANRDLHNNRTYSPSMASSHYGEVNYAHTSRRRSRFDNRHGAQFWIPWAMKGILASPVVVLLIWFIIVAVHHPTATESTMKSHRYGASSKNNSPRYLQQQQPNSLMSASHQKHTGSDKHIPVYVPLGQEQPQQQFVPAMYSNNGMQMAAPQMGIPQSQSQNNFLMAREGQPLGMSIAQGQDLSGFTQQQPQMMMQQAQNSNYMMSGQNMMQLTQQQPGQMYQQQPGQMYQQPQMQQYQQRLQQVQPMQQVQPQMMMTAEDPLIQLQQVEPQVLMQQELPGQEPQYQQPLMTMARGGGSNHRQSQKPVHPSKWGSFLRGGRNMVESSKQRASIAQEEPKIYYYDPAQAVMQNGQFQAPSVVYDQHGNEVELASLTASKSDLYIEPPAREDLMTSPRYGSSSSSSSGNERRNLVANTTDSTADLLLPPPPLQMKIKAPESWGTSTAQDQSIIVCTVAVMALLVGALSARRMRAKSFLSSCIENESLEDEVAFDNAYTISGGDSYNTFGWKGDLEKFDV